jgi:hypothetical protein
VVYRVDERDAVLGRGRGRGRDKHIVHAVGELLEYETVLL